MLQTEGSIEYNSVLIEVSSLASTSSYNDLPGKSWVKSKT